MVTFTFYKTGDASKAAEAFSRYGLDYSGCNRKITICRNQLRKALKALDEAKVVDYNF